MQQADKKEHTHRETGVGAEMRILKGMYCDSISGYFFFYPKFQNIPQMLWTSKGFSGSIFNLKSSSGFFRVFQGFPFTCYPSDFCLLNKERKVECRSDLRTKPLWKVIHKTTTFSYLNFWQERGGLKQNKTKPNHLFSLSFLKASLFSVSAIIQCFLIDNYSPQHFLPLLLCWIPLCANILQRLLCSCSDLLILVLMYSHF